MLFGFILFLGVDQPDKNLYGPFQLLVPAAYHHFGSVCDCNIGFQLRILEILSLPSDIR